MALNPFRPSFGVTPPVLVGRDNAVLAFGDALDAGPGAPGRATLYTGVRGIGKTVMLNEAETQARERGWVVVSETAVPGLVDRLTAHRLPEAAAAGRKPGDGSRRSPSRSISAASPGNHRLPSTVQTFVPN